MKLSQSVTTEIRFDKELKLIGDRKGVHNKSECTAYCFDGATENNPIAFGVGIRIRFWFYIDTEENEVAGYLSETEAIVLEYTTPVKDLEMLLYFVNDTFFKIKEYLQKNLYPLDLSHFDYPQPLTFSNGLLDGLIKLGLYLPR